MSEAALFYSAFKLAGINFTTLYKQLTMVKDYLQAEIQEI